MFKKIAPDKWRHFYVGILLGLLLQAMGYWWLESWPVGKFLVPFLILSAISYGFEVFSKITGWGYYEVMDAVAAIIGGVLGMAVVILAKVLLY